MALALRAMGKDATVGHRRHTAGFLQPSRRCRHGITPEVTDTSMRPVMECSDLTGTA